MQYRFSKQTIHIIAENRSGADKDRLRVTACRIFRSAWPVLMTAVLLGSGRLAAQMGFTVYPSEYQIKSRYIVNLVRYVDWPENAFQDTSSPYIIGLTGNDPYGIDLEKAIEGKTINNRHFIIRQFEENEVIGKCHILVVGSRERDFHRKVLLKIRSRSILSISDSPFFAEDGGMIHFVIRKKKIRFQINTAAVKQSGLKISTKILKMAEITG